MVYCRSILSKEEVELLCIIFWRIWFWRNQLLQDSQCRRSEDVVAWATDYIGEYRKANQVGESLPSRLHSTCPVKWSKPAAGWFKINTDAAIREADRLVGTGALVRVSVGNVLTCAVQRFETCFDPATADAFAILQGLRLAVDGGFLPAVLESDAKGVVELINSGSCIFSDIGVVISDIVALASTSNISIVFIPRKANEAAHALAKLALSFSSVHLWQESCPPYLESFISFDACV